MICSGKFENVLLNTLSTQMDGGFLNRIQESCRKIEYAIQDSELVMKSLKEKEGQSDMREVEASEITEDSGEYAVTTLTRTYETDDDEEDEEDEEDDEEDEEDDEYLDDTDSCNKEDCDCYKCKDECAITCYEIFCGRRSREKIE